MQPLFITGIGTAVGKTLAAAVITEALHADYWKPIQAGLDEGTDALTIQELLSNVDSVIHPELYKLNTPASPHIAARIDGVMMNGGEIAAASKLILHKAGNRQLVIEGAGGLLVPVNDTLLVADLIKLLGAKVILVSRNYLGSINHSLLTAAYCQSNGIDVAGWIFNDDYMNYENEIANWSGYPSLGSIPKMETISKQTILQQANLLKPSLQNLFNQA
jgi:dethiobiotin synthetase